MPKSRIQIELSGFKYKKDKLKELIIKINNLSSNIYSINSTSIINYIKDRNIKDSNYNSIDKQLIKLADMQEEYKRLLFEANDECIRIANIIDKNIKDPLINQIFYKYYCCDQSFEMIAVDLSYSFDWIRKKFYKEINRLEKESVHKKTQINVL